MTILQRLGTQFQHLFPANEHGQERAQWFLLALQAILLPITASRTSHSPTEDPGPDAPG